MNTVVLQPGDVLLYSGQSLIGKLIRKLDGTEVTHAGIYLGDDTVGEALMVGRPGINANPLATSIQGTDWVEVRRLPDAELDRKLLLDVAQRYIDQGNRYAYAEILLVATICLTRKLDLHHWLLGRIALGAMNQANRLIAAMVDQGKEPMICSEFVYRCYDEALDADDDPYSLTILSQQGAPSRRRSRRRLRRQALTAAAASDIPNIHPESLLGRIMAEPQKVQRMTKAGAPEVAPPLEMTDEEQEALIAEYVGESPPTQAMRAPSVPEPTQQDLEQAATDFAASLLASDDRQYGALQDAPPTTRIATAIADFVTPGDLLKSPSLEKVGRITQSKT
jgi:hypothetical protein